MTSLNPIARRKPRTEALSSSVSSANCIFCRICNLFSDSGVLSHPVHSRKTARELHRMIHQGEIDLNPPYQRGTISPFLPSLFAILLFSTDVVWTDAKQSALCGSVIRNYYVPAILLLKSRIGDGVDGADVLVCVDGKQRLTSIQKFIDGQVSAHFCWQSFILMSVCNVDFSYVLLSLEAILWQC